MALTATDPLAEAASVSPAGGGPNERPFELETADADALAQLAAAIPAEAMEASLSEQDDTPAGRPCPTCGQPLLMKEDRFGGYLACSGFPACRYAEASRPEAEPVMACPLCRLGRIIVKRTASGRTLYVCREEGCEFLSWSRPHAGKCPACQAPYLIERKKADGAIVLGCPQTGCGFRQGPERGEGDREGVRKVKVRVVRRAGAGAAGGKRKVVVVRRRK
jgi:ssDNA-binding Zn-finger/Zn-ribbon topoisomerase 1